MELYILRHGIAVEPGTPGYERDADRPLTPEGERKLKQIARAMEALGLSFDLILSSPYLRARQTAEIVAEVLKGRKRLELSDSLTPDGNTKKLVEQLRRARAFLRERAARGPRTLPEWADCHAGVREGDLLRSYEEGRLVQAFDRVVESRPLRRPGVADHAQADGADGLSRRHAVGNGEHARPGRIQPAPPPGGGAACRVT